MLIHLFYIFLYSSTSLFSFYGIEEPESKRDNIVNFAQNFSKTPYLWRGTSLKGFDYSGFLYYIYRKHTTNVDLTSSSDSKINLSNVQSENFLLFTGTDSSKQKISPIGIVIRNLNGMIRFIQASHQKTLRC